MRPDQDEGNTAAARDDGGLFVVMIEGQNQAPIIMETEGYDSGERAAFDRLQRLLRNNTIGGAAIRGCVCRLTPVSGNMLLPLDMQRMQK